MKNSFRFDFRRNLSLSRKLPRSFVKSIAEQHGGDVIVEYNNLCQLFQSKAIVPNQGSGENIANDYRSGKNPYC